MAMLNAQWYPSKCCPIMYQLEFHVWHSENSFYSIVVSLLKWSAHFHLNIFLQSLGAINQIIQENESCPLGFKLSQGECIDINECQAGTNDCMDSQRCENTIGSFICVR